MPHIDELTMMMYIDQELLPDEHQRVTAHLQECPSCQQSYALWQTDQSFFHDSFAEADEQEPACSLNKHTLAQIEMIAALHEHHHQSLFRRVVPWFLSSIAVVTLLFFLFSNWGNVWVSQLSTYWTKHFFWSSAFWLKDNASDLLALSLANFYWFLFLFTCLLGGLVVLNARRSTNPRMYERGADQ
jgi:predicted anti-sigma-YlaC factor YlaD